MKTRIRSILAAIGALSFLSTLSGCIFVERGGGRGHCFAPPIRTICAGPAWGHHR